MPDNLAGASKQDTASETAEHLASINHSKPEDRITALSSNLLDRGDSIIYAVVGACFFLGGIIALVYSFWHLVVSLTLPGVLKPTDLAQAIIQFISDLLLVLIIMEVLGTVIHYLKVRTTSLRPFLFIGIVSATRSILSISARLVVENIQQVDFIRAMIELGVNAAVILALGITLKLLGNLVES